MELIRPGTIYIGYRLCPTFEKVPETIVFLLFIFKVFLLKRLLVISYYCKNGQNQILLLKTCQKFSKSDQICCVFKHSILKISIAENRVTSASKNNSNKTLSQP